MKLKHLLILAVLPALSHAQVHTSIQKVVDKNPTWYYTFEDKDDLAAPTVGTEKLIFCTPGDDPKVGRPDGPPPTPILGPDENKQAVRIDYGNPIKVFNPGPQTTDGGNRQNTWTLLYDVKVVQTGVYHGLFEFHGDESANADGYVNIDGNPANTSLVGVGNSGYGRPYIKPDVWYRIVLTQSWEDGKPHYRIYLDGDEILNNYEPVSLLDGRYSVGDYFWIFPADATSSYSYFYTAGFAYWAGKSLTREEIASFGKSDVYPKTPFNGPHNVPGIIEAEDFDLGGEGLAYHNNDAAATNSYRSSEHVEIEAGPEADNYHLVTDQGEWYKYTIEAPEARVPEYIFTFYWANTKAGGTFDVLIDGVAIQDVTTGVEIPNTGSNDVYEEAEFTVPVTLTAGKHVITVKTTSGGNLDKINITRMAFSYQGTPFSGTPLNVSFDTDATIEAEDFDIGGEGISFRAGNNNVNDLSRAHRANAGDGSEAVSLENRNGGLTIGNFASGDWTAYTINVQEEGLYDIFLMLATGNDDRKNRIEIDDVTYPEFTSHTSDWGNFENFRAASVELSAGIHTLFVYFNSNFDKISFTRHVDVFPYENTPQTIPGIVQAWKFDDGGNGLTYLVTDKTLGGEKNAIRQDTEVPIKYDDLEGYYVSVDDFNTPTWLLYTVDVKETGYYKLTFRVGCDTGGESYTLSNRSWSAPVLLPNAPGDWVDLTFPLVKLNAGLDTLRIVTSGAAIQIASIKFEPIADVIDKSNWSVVSFLGEDPNDGGGINAAFDDDFSTFWHAGSTVHELPHWAIYDLGAPVEISQLITFRRSSYPDVKTVQYSVSNDPDLAIEEWPVIAEGEFADNNGKNLGLTLDVTQTVKARYLKLLLPDSYREVYTNIVEIYAIGKVFDGIKVIEKTLPGIVYAENDVLKVKGFSANASLAVYNLLGQKISAYKTVNDGTEVKLPAKGIYIVKIQDKGKTASFKVVSK
jgi:hypothetical protein